MTAGHYDALLAQMDAAVSMGLGLGTVDTERAAAALRESEEENSRLRKAILDIDAHATGLGEDADGFVTGGYLISIGCLHRALGLVGQTGVKVQWERHEGAVAAARAEAETLRTERDSARAAHQTTHDLSKHWAARAVAAEGQLDLLRTRAERVEGLLRRVLDLDDWFWHQPTKLNDPVRCTYERCEQPWPCPNAQDRAAIKAFLAEATPQPEFVTLSPDDLAAREAVLRAPSSVYSDAVFEDEATPQPEEAS